MSGLHRGYTTSSTTGCGQMSERKEHNAFDEIVLGKKKRRKYDEVNAYIDKPSRYLGPSHRSLFHSTDLSRLDTQMILAKFGVDGLVMQRLHIMLDKDKGLQKLMEMYIKKKR